jgi:MHS family proline/betaine transporter-like MFS transporter
MFRSSNIFLAVSAIFVEWIEFSIFVYLNTIFSKNFFPMQKPEVATMMTFGIFAVSYFIRPLAAAIYGYIADKRGRKKVMVFSILLMSISTVSIGLLPDYSKIGVAAPILLLFFRALQGFAIAVEFNNSGNFLIEHLKENRIIASSLVVASATGGMSAGAFIVSIMDFETYPWIWRVPFVVAALLSFFVFIMRRGMNETPEFLSLAKNNAFSDNPFHEVLKTHKVRMMMIAVFSAFIAVMLYGGHVYFASNYLIKTGGLSLSESSRLAFFTELGLTIVIPLVAVFGQKKNCYPLLVKSGIIIIGMVCPLLFYYGKNPVENYLELSICVAIYVIGDSMFSSSIFYYIYALLPVNVRCTGSGFAYSVSVAIVGGTTPLICDTLVKQGMHLGPGFYISFVALITYFVFRSANILVKKQNAEVALSQNQKSH